MIHPSRLPGRRLPTVGELKKMLSKYADDCPVAYVNLEQKVVAPQPRVKTVYRDKAGNLYPSRLESSSAKAVRVIGL